MFVYVWIGVAVIDEDQPVPMDVMHRANTTRLCKQHGLYLAPNLNDRLYLQASARESLSTAVCDDADSCVTWCQGQGYRKIQNLEEHTRLRGALHTEHRATRFFAFRCCYRVLLVTVERLFPTP